MKAQDPLSPPDAARRRFTLVQIGVLGAFAATMIAIGQIMPRIETPALRWVIAALPLALLLYWAWAFFGMIRDDDEMMQRIHLRAVALGAGLVLLAATLWGILEKLMDVPGLPSFLLLPAFALLYSFAFWRAKEGG